MTRQQAAVYKQRLCVAYNARFAAQGLRCVMNEALYVLADQGQLVLITDTKAAPQPLCFELTALTEIDHNNQLPYQNTPALLTLLLKRLALRPGMKAFKQLCVTTQTQLLAYRRKHPYVTSLFQAQTGFNLASGAVTQQALAQSHREFAPRLASVKRQQLPYMNQVLQAITPQATVDVTEAGLFVLREGTQQLAIEVALNQLDVRANQSRPQLPQRMQTCNASLYQAFCRLTVAFDQLYQRALLRDTAVNF